MYETSHALRMACAMWLRDPATTLTPKQAAWLRTRLATPTALTPTERTRIAPELQAWATALEPRLGAVVAQLLAGTIPPAPAAGNTEDRLRFVAGTVPAREDQ